MKKLFFILTALTLALSACGASPDQPVSSDPSYPNPSYPNSTDSNGYTPQDSDASLTRAEAYIDSSELLIMESYPPQFMLNLKGSLPTVCHQLRINVSSPDAENKIFVDVYTVVSPDTVCIQVLSLFEVNVSLGSFATGHYILFVNGIQVTEFDA